MMKRILVGLALCVFLGWLAWGTMVPTPWRYGVIYWVGGVPERAQGYINVATNLVRQVLGGWDMPVPRPTGDWRAPVEVSAPDRETARLELGPDFSPMGIVVPGPSPEVFWAVAPLRLGDREIQPLTIVVFSELELFWAACGNYLAGGIFSPSPSESCCAELWEPWLKGFIGENASPTILLPLRALLSASDDYFLSALSHELAHWAFWLWCQEHSLELDGIPLLLVEGLAEYTRLLVRKVAMYRIPPAEAHPVAAMWAEEGGLRDVPYSLSHEVGLSLVDFLARKHRWGRFLVLLPDYIRNWDENLSLWEPEWKEWLSEAPSDQEEEGFSDWVSVYFQVVNQLLPVAIMLQPLLPQALEMALDVETEDDISRFWEQMAGPFPEPSPEIWEELGKRERTFLMVEWHRLERCDAPPEVEELVESLHELRREGDWEGYITTYLQGVREIIAQLPASVGVVP